MRTSLPSNTLCISSFTSSQFNLSLADFFSFDKVKGEKVCLHPIFGIAKSRTPMFPHLLLQVQ